jgi:hypothetical protein
MRADAVHDSRYAVGASVSGRVRTASDLVDHGDRTRPFVAVAAFWTEW